MITFIIFNKKRDIYNFEKENKHMDHEYYKIKIQNGWNFDLKQYNDNNNINKNKTHGIIDTCKTNKYYRLEKNRTI